MLDFTNGKTATIDPDGVHIIVEDIKKKIDNKKISPSLITSLSQCPARWVAETFILPEIIDFQSVAAQRGSAFHKVMELFYSRQPQTRTKQSLKEDVKKVVQSEEFSSFFQDNEHKEWLLNALKGYYQSVTTDPSEDAVAHITINGEEKEGLELFVHGHLGSAKREVLGFVDRILVDENNKNCVKVEDYKTGGTVKRWNPRTKNDDGLAEARQQTIYSMLLEKEGLQVSQSSLIFPIVGDIVNVDIHNEKFRQRVIEDIEQTDERLDTLQKENTYFFKPSFLCSWCPLAKICPQADINMGSEKMKKAFLSQPDASTLQQVFL